MNILRLELIQHKFKINLQNGPLDYRHDLLPDSIDGFFSATVPFSWKCFLILTKYCNLHDLFFLPFIPKHYKDLKGLEFKSVKPFEVPVLATYSLAKKKKT